MTVKTPARVFFLTIAASTALACAKRDEDATPIGNLAKAGSDSAARVDADPAAPDSFRVAFETGKGRFIVEVKRAWAPRGVDRFHALVTSGYYDRVKFFRVIPGFIAQFGISGDPAMNQKWSAQIPDDPVKESNRKGTVTFATAGPNTRTTQLFVNTKDNPMLDGMGFAPFGRVVEGIDVVEKLYAEYGEGPPEGRGPMQNRIEQEGNRYLNQSFPKLDSIITARIIR